ncbi:MAG: beta strand repeat-containing protein, partial [Alphaproteobacteria bacterium]
AAAGTTVGITALSTDDDVTGEVTYSLSDDAGGLFAIDASTGVVTVAGALDAEAAESHNIVVEASDGTSTASETFTIGVTDVNEFAPTTPVDDDPADNQVAEDAAAGTTVGITALSTDDDVTGEVTYSLSDDAGGLFAIDASTGVVTVAGALDAETAESHNIVVEASDGTNTASETFTIGVTDVNEFAPTTPVDDDPADNQVAEDAAAGTTVGITALSTDDDVTGEVTYSLSDDAGGLFAIDASTGVVTVAGALDAETAESHNIVVEASDGTSTASETFTIGVTDVNEFAPTTPVDDDPADNQVAEDAAAGTTVGITALSTDDDVTGEVTYSLSDDAGGLFAIDASTGVVTVAGVLDAETAESHAIVVDASDGTSTASETFTIGVTDVNEFAPTTPVDDDPADNQVAEDAAAGTTVGITALSTDDDVTGEVTYSLSDDAGGLFAIDASTGVVTVAGALDAETAESHNIVVEASDGTSTASETFTIGVTDVNEFAPTTPVDDDPADNQVAEDAAAGTTVGITALSTDDDVTGEVTYSLSDDAGGLFAIDASTGVVTVAGVLDAETAESHAIVVEASDGTSTASETFTIGVTDVNEFAPTTPVDDDPADNQVAEDAAAGTTVGITALSTDDDVTGEVTYSLSDNAGGLFAIDASTGVVTVAGALDAETAGSHNIVVEASDGTGTASETFTIGVTDVNEFAPATPVDDDEAANEVQENAVVGALVGITALATDDDATGEVTYSLSDDAGGLFAIDATTGVVTVAGALDAETAASHNIVVEASDGLNTSSETFTIGVLDENEFAPTAPVDDDAADDQVSEDAAAGTTVGITALSTDDDVSATIEYSLTDDAGGLFAIDASTGVVTVAGALDAETAADHSIVIQASDGTNTASETFTIGVLDVNEFAPTEPVDDDPADNLASEDAAVGTTVGITALSTDDDASAAIEYSLTDDAGGLFAIDSASGIVTVAGALDFETAASHDIVVQASDGTNSASATFSIGVTDVEESAGLTSAELLDTGDSLAGLLGDNGSGGGGVVATQSSFNIAAAGTTSLPLVDDTQLAVN